MAGFESSCHINLQGKRLDMIAATQHDRSVDEDYARLRSIGVFGARYRALASYRASKWRV